MNDEKHEFVEYYELDAVNDEDEVDKVNEQIEKELREVKKACLEFEMEEVELYVENAAKAEKMKYDEENNLVAMDNCYSSEKVHEMDKIRPKSQVCSIVDNFPENYYL